MTKQAMSLIALSILVMCGSSQATINNDTVSDALFTDIAAADGSSCDGIPEVKPCTELNLKTTHDLFAQGGGPVWLDELEECQWDEIEAYYSELYGDEDIIIVDNGDIENKTRPKGVIVAADVGSESDAQVDRLSEYELQQARKAMAAIAVKPIPREVKPKVKSKPKSNIAKIKPEKRGSEKKRPATIAKKKSGAVDKSRSVQRAITYTVRGKSYTTVADSAGFVQKGVASWYGKRFHGLKTASGEPYDMNAMTAAHKKLPLGTKIEVVNNENGKKVVVTVNDRGPFHGNRVLDLSKAAAKELGVVDQGTADVTIRAL